MLLISTRILICWVNAIWHCKSIAVLQDLHAPSIDDQPMASAVVQQIWVLFYILKSQWFLLYLIKSIHFTIGVCPETEKAYITNDMTVRECQINQNLTCPTNYLCRFNRQKSRYYCCASISGGIFLNVFKQIYGLYLRFVPNWQGTISWSIHKCTNSMYADPWQCLPTRLQMSVDDQWCVSRILLFEKIVSRPSIYDVVDRKARTKCVYA
jgi:hypothetical protein